MTSAYMPLYTGDWDRDTAHLSCEEDGAYGRIARFYWSRGSALSDDDADFARITRLTIGKWRKIRKKIEDFFYIFNGLWIHKKIEEELLKRQHKAENGRLGGKSTQANAKQTAKQNSSPKPSQVKEERKKEDMPRKRAASPKVLLPIDWSPSWQLSTEEQTQLPRFVDDALAHSRRYASWDAAFRNWVRRQPEFQRNGGQSGGRVISGAGLFSAEAVAERAWRRERANRQRESDTAPGMAGRPSGERLRSLERSAVPENAGDNRVGESSGERVGDDAGMHKTG